MSKHNNRNIISHISKASGLPMDMLGRAPMLHMYSDNEIVIEGVADIDLYEEKCVKIAVKKMFITICGEKLKIRCFANMNLSVTGYISSVNFDYTE